MTLTDQLSTQLDNQPLSVEDSPVSLTVLQENVRRLVMTVTSGPKSEESYAKLNRNGSWVRMCRGYAQASLDGSLVEFCETWPKWGIVSDGVAGRLPILEPPTTGNECSLLPTPDTCPEAPNNNANRIYYPKNLLQAARDNYTPPNWPTPRANERGGYQRDRGMKGKERPTLTGAVRLWPTPMCPTHHNIGTMQEWGGSGNKIRKLLPTVSARDHRSGKGSQERQGHAPPLTDIAGGLLNPTWVEWLMGFPEEWTALSASEMPLSRSKSTRSSKQSQTLKGEVVE